MAATKPQINFVGIDGNPESACEPGNVHVECYQIMGDGTRDSRKRRVIMGRIRKFHSINQFVATPCETWMSAADCVERAMFEIDEAFHKGNSLDQSDDLIRTIEVVGHPSHPEPIRFRVTTRVKIEYEAEEITS